jgi:hypothetical protein
METATFDPEKYYLFVSEEEDVLLRKAINSTLRASGVVTKTGPGCCEEEWVESTIDENIPKGFDYRVVAFEGIKLLRKTPDLKSEEKQTFLNNFVLEKRNEAVSSKIDIKRQIKGNK